MENIEAMLCAYIEGDLDQTGRAEIEKHLQANPQHRKLIEELIATRDMVRRLPRVSAPLDVGESLRGHVERSILLEDSTPMPGARPMSIGRGRRILAIAAIFLLVAGTGILIVQRVLPGFKPPQSPQENMQARLTPGTLATPGTLPEERSLSAAHAPDDSLLNDATRTSRMSEALAATPPLNNPAVPVTFDLAAIQRRLESSGYAAAPGQPDGVSPVYLVIQSPNPSMTNEKIARFLNSNGITFSPIPEPMPAANATTMPSVDDAARAMNNPAASNAAMASPTAANNSYNNNNARYENNNNANAPANAGAQAVNAVPPDPDGQSNEMAAKRQQADAPANNAPALEQQAAAAQQNQIPAAASRPSAEIDKALAPSPVETRFQDLYVARGMTHKQADELRDALAAQQDAPVTLYDQLAFSADRDHQPLAPATQPTQAMIDALKSTTDANAAGKKDESKPAAATTQPSDAPLAAGDLIEVHLANVDLPPGDNALQTLTVADDGTIALPGIGPVRVAGSTLSQTQAAITKVYADAKLNVEPQPEVTVRKPQTIAQPGKSNEDALDVVIVIQNAPQSQSQSQPQTQQQPQPQTVIMPQIQSPPATQP